MAVVSSHAGQEQPMSMVTTIGRDIAKSVFQMHGISASGEVQIRRQIQ
jgi:transposase